MRWSRIPVRHDGPKCPNCHRPTRVRIFGYFCVPCKGWLTEEVRHDGTKIVRLDQGVLG